MAPLQSQGAKLLPGSHCVPRTFPELRCKWLSAAVKEQPAPGRGASDLVSSRIPGRGRQHQAEQREGRASH